MIQGLDPLQVDALQKLGYPDEVILIVLPYVGRQDFAFAEMLVWVSRKPVPARAQKLLDLHRAQRTRQVWQAWDQLYPTLSNTWKRALARDDILPTFGGRFFKRSREDKDE